MCIRDSLHHLHQTPVGRLARNHEPRRLEPRAKGAVHLEAVAVPLARQFLAVGRERARAGAHAARVGTQAHGAALVLYALLLGHEVDHGMRRRRVELGGRGAGKPRHVAGELAHGRLQPQADARCV